MHTLDDTPTRITLDPVEGDDELAPRALATAPPPVPDAAATGHALRRHLRRVLPYAVAMFAVSLATLVRLALSPHLKYEAPFLLMLGAVMASAWYGGFGPGVAATILAAALSNFLFMDPTYRFSFDQEQGVRLGMFILEALFICVLCATLHRARRRAEVSAAESRALEREVARVSDAEQTRLGHDLHDGLGQHLTGVTFLAKRLQTRLATEGRPEAMEAGEIVQLVSESIGWTRDLARGLAPVDLGRTNLPSALRELAAKTERMCRVRCSYDGDDRLTVVDDATALNLYRVAQEAVNNAIKHGRAREIHIELDRDAADTTLLVRDDGIGIGPGLSVGTGDGNGRGNDRPGNPFSARPAARKGMGLKIMGYRARTVGASLSVQPGQRGGTTVRCTQPASARPVLRTQEFEDPTDRAQEPTTLRVPRSV